MEQKEIYIKCKRDKVQASTGRAFVMLYWDDVLAAMENLTPSEFKVWLYLARQVNYEVWFHYGTIAEELALSYQGIKNAFNSLVKKNYIHQLSENYFTFNIRAIGEGFNAYGGVAPVGRSTTTHPSPRAVE